jgi:pyruvate,water dikinase
MAHILPLRDAHDPALAGGKAASLSNLLAAGLPVPDGFVVTESAFMASRVGADARLPGRPAPAVVRDIDAALTALGTAGAPVAVRSSALDEDGPRCSFAGQFESFLCVPQDRVPQRVAEVWRSGFADRVLAYRLRMGAAASARAPAVLVQRMVAADAAGVAFGADPLEGTPDIAVVHAVPGLASGLVDGEAEGDSFRFDRRGRLLASQVADKVWAWRPGGDGPQRVALPPAAQRRAVLDESQARAVAELVRRCGRIAGRPQDIEWAYSGGRLWLLQSRPITTPAAAPARVVWDNSNIAESYAGVTTPLTFSYIRRNYAAAYRSLCRLAGIGEAQIAAHDELFGNMLGLLRGRVYYNLSSWYTLLALIPAFGLNKPLLDQMLGVRAQGGAAPAPRSPGGPARWVASARIALTILSHQLTLASRVRRFERRLEDALAAPDPPLAARDAAQLVAYQHDIDRQLLTRWDAPLVNDFFLMVFHGVLRRLVTRWLGAVPQGLDNRLLCNDGGIVSTEPARLIVEMAALAATDAAFVERLLGAAPGRPPAALPPDFGRLLREYLDRFGDRCHHELMLESRTLHDDPAPLLRAIGAAARRGPARAGEGPATRAQAERELAGALAGHPLRRWIFGWVLAHTRARLRGRESLRLARTRAYARTRGVLNELGRRLVAGGLLDAPEDIHWLEVDELFGFVEGTSTTTDLRHLAALRRTEFERFRAEPPPPERLETAGAVHLGLLPTAQDEAADPAVRELRQGQGCGSGRARGRVRIVTDPASACIGPGEILVAARTDPGWVMLFPLAAGLVVERGSLLSHAAIVAREMGLPAVVGLRGACRWLADGDEVEVDGTQGTVRRLAPQPAA